MVALSLVLGGAGLAAVAITQAGATTINPGCTLSSTVASATGVNLTCSFSTASASALSSVTITVPSGTGGTPLVGTVSGLPGPGTIALASNTLTYAFPSTLVGSGVNVTIQITGLTNTATVASNNTFTVTTLSGLSLVDTGTTATAFAIAPGSLGNLIWSPSSVVTGAPASYSYYFTTATTLPTGSASISMTVPAGTTSGTLSVSSISGIQSGGALALSSNVLTYTVTLASSVSAGTTIALTIGGLTNTTTVQAFTAEVWTTSGTPLDAALAEPVSFGAGSLLGAQWSSTSAVGGTTGVSYTYSFTTATTAVLSSVTMTVPPGTGGTPAVGTVSGVPSGGTVVLSASSNTLTYSFAPTAVAASVVASIQLTGLTNTSSVGVYSSLLATNTAFAPVDVGITTGLGIGPTTLATVGWTPTPTSTATASTSYTYTFTCSSQTLTTVWMTVPPGTTGTPAISASTTGVPNAGGTITLANNVLTYTFASTPSVTSASVVVTGLTNTPIVGSYTVQVAIGQTTPNATGTTSAVSFPGGGTLTSPTWTSSSVTTSATAVSYSYSFTTSSSSTLTSISFTVPSGTTIATPSASSVSGVPSGGTVTYTSPKLTYTFASAYVRAGTAVSLTITGATFTNTATAGTYTSAIATLNGATTIDSGTTGSVVLTATALTALGWVATSAVTGTSSVTYTYTFTSTPQAETSVTLTVPPGTSGTPAAGTITGITSPGAPTLSGNLLTFTFGSQTVSGAVSIGVTGLNNTSTAGYYTSMITLIDNGTAERSGVATFGFGSGVATSPTWASTTMVANTTGSTYTFSFTTGTTANLTSVTMTLATTTNFTPTVTSATGIPACTTSIAETTNVITCTFPSTKVNAGTAVTLVLGASRTPTTASAADTVAIATKVGTTAIDTGTTNSLTFATGALTALGWAVTNHNGGATPVSYTYTFTNTTSHAETAIAMSVPPGTTGTPVLGTISGAATNLPPTGGTFSLAANVLTYTFASHNVGGGPGTVSFQVTGMTNTNTPGSYTSAISLIDAGTNEYAGTTTAATIVGVPPTLTLTDSCASSTTTCQTSTTGNVLTLLAIPGLQTPITASVALGVQSNASGGYTVKSQASTLTNGSYTLAQAPTSGSSSVPTDAFYATAIMSGSGSSGAALCAPYGGSQPYVGFNTSSAQSIWYATASTGTNTDTVTLNVAVMVSNLKQPGDYTGNINFSVIPQFTGTATC
jgi:hypothetical protein